MTESSPSSGGPALPLRLYSGHAPRFTLGELGYDGDEIDEMTAAYHDHFAIEPGPSTRRVDGDGRPSPRPKEKQVRLTDFSVLTFDCYGTLIDWEAGLLAALQPLLSLADEPPPADEALALFGRLEKAQEAATPGMLYRDVLAAVHRDLAAHWGVQAAEVHHRRFGDSIPEWPAFPDSAEALAYLADHYYLVILSNVDERSFSGSNVRLGVELDAIYTAERIGSYKPAAANFEYLIAAVERDLGREKHEILHTAQSLFHDHVPARAHGLATAWIDRRQGRTGWGATPPPEEIPATDFHFASMAELAEAHRRELGG